MLKGQVSIYPNPAANTLYATWDAIKAGTEKIFITDNTGRISYNTTNNSFAEINKIAVPVAQLHPGIYTLLIDDGIHKNAVHFYKE